jgi:hypothetical protein
MKSFRACAAEIVGSSALRVAALQIVPLVGYMIDVQPAAYGIAAAAGVWASQYWKRSINRRYGIESGSDFYSSCQSFDFLSMSATAGVIGSAIILGNGVSDLAYAVIGGTGISVGGVSSYFAVRGFRQLRSDFDTRGEAPQQTTSDNESQEIIQENSSQLREGEADLDKTVEELQAKNPRPAPQPKSRFLRRFWPL